MSATSPTLPLTPIAEPDSVAVPMPPLRRGQRRTSLYDLSLPALTARMVEWGEPTYRATQLYGWAYKRLATGYDEMTELPTTVRARLAAEVPLGTLRPERELVSDDGQTVKTLYLTADGQYIETVLMYYPDRVTVCVSCQVGCAVGCVFCATGLGGLMRNLSAGEIVAQVVDAARAARVRGRELTNVVMMGMGEPFHNYAATMAFVGILHDPQGLNMGARRITISTSGVVPRIDALADEPYQVNLAVSLHAPTDELRSALMPINRRYPIAELLAACHRYGEKTGRRVSFEYALMAGDNDDEAIARDLGGLLRRNGVLCHVNLIPLNPVEDLRYERPKAESIERFAATLRATGIPTTIRYSRGVEIAAACGQLRQTQRQEQVAPAAAAVPATA